MMLTLFAMLSLLILFPVVVVTITVIHRLTLHPLAKYPGPILAKLTDLYSVYHAIIGDLQLDMWRCHENYGEVVRYGPDKLIFNTSSAIRDIYSRSANVQKSTAYRAFETSPTAHDLQSTVDKLAHARKRRVMSQAFSESAVKSFENYALRHVRLFVDCLSTPAPKSEGFHATDRSQHRNMAHWCNYLSFDLMAELVFGKAFDMLESGNNRKIIDWIQYAAFRVGVCLQMPQLAVWNVDRFLAPGVRKMRDNYVTASKDLMRQRVEAKIPRQDLFSHILACKDPETGEGFSTDELWGEATLLIVAGSDAISTAMASCFFYLSRNRQAYEKARDEIRRTFDSAQQIRSGSELNSCVYLRACIEESLRMSPPVGGALWRETCSGNLKVGETIVPAHHDVGVGIYAIHHNELYFPDPFKYLPERWIVSEDNSKQSIASARRAFTPFSIGPVGCLGKNLAYTELTLTMAHVLWSLDLLVDDLDFTEAEAEAAKGEYLQLYRDHADYEYRLQDRFTSWKDGPMLRFRARGGH